MEKKFGVKKETDHLLNRIYQKVKVLRKFDGFIKTFTFVIDDEALVLDFDNNNNLTKTSISITYKDNI